MPALPPVDNRFASGFRSLVGYETIAWRDGYAEIALTIGPQHLNSIAIVHGGVYVTILDAVLGHAACWCDTPGHVRASVTVSLTTSFLKGAREGMRLVARGRLIGVNDRMATCAGDIVDPAGTLCATGQGSFRYLPGSQAAEGFPGAPKQR
ncbi:MAG: PaaI family thioesterase [Pseudomonadota bacterium]